MAIRLKTLPPITVTQAGGRKRLSETSVLVYSVAVQSLRTNTGYQYIGDDTVSSSNGQEFGPSDMVEIEPPMGGKEPQQFDLKEIWVDSSTNGAEFRVIIWIRV